jgi:glyoxylase-like metal-dependent hydrolase (beta-lactamase superfamily II)
MNRRYQFGSYQIDTYTIGQYGVNNYVIHNPETRHAVLIDAGDEIEEIAHFISSKAYKLSHLINTHTHLDHIAGNALIKKKFGSAIVVHEFEAPALLDPKKNLSVFMGMEIISPPADRTVRDQDVIKIEELEFKVFHCPGHSIGGIAILLDTFLFCGDILFKGSIGRTDFPDGDQDLLVKNIKEKLFNLPDDTIVFPGHGPATTIGEEKRHNPFLREQE